ncbi:MULTISPECIES: hypothetical protein [Gordonia]|uniref:hypothetical protein n=1 Tax=Gordonia TaxID=2053 RepID=UPI003393D544
MTKFLGAGWVDSTTVQLIWADDPTVALSQRGGRVSPVFPLNLSICPDTLPSRGCIALLFAASPRSLFAEILDRLEGDDLIFMSHGLACGVLVSHRSSADTAHWLSSFVDQLSAFEIWPFENARVDTRLIETFRTEVNLPVELELVEYNSLPGPIRVEVRQFNANLTLFATAAQEFAPEMMSLCEWLNESVSSRVERIRQELAASNTDISFARRLHHDVSILVDINSCLTMVISQFADVVPPVLNASFPVGEHSLLGIGSATRSVWAVYDHISNVFGTADHPNRLQDAFDAAGFDPGMNANNVDYQSWRKASGTALGKAASLSDQQPRKHLVYFSSRWGFHETLNAISLSWQTIGSGATREWNLLTLSHEFLHSHFRELIRSNVLPITSDTMRHDLIDLYNKVFASIGPGAPTDGPRNFLESMQVFFLHQMKLIEQASLEVGTLSSTTSVIEIYSSPITDGELQRLMSSPLLDFVEEVLVHVMDYYFFYNADDQAYVSSLWHSWTLVPQVHRKLRHYVLRTLFALASSNNSTDVKELFVDAFTRLKAELEEMQKSGDNALVDAGLAELTDHDAKKELYARFKYNYLLSIFAREFLVTENLYSRLNADSQTAAGPPPRYRIQPGEFPDWSIQSPSGFLLDRFQSFTQEPEDAEAESLWQLLVLI